MKTVQMLFTVHEGMDAEKYFNELCNAVRPVLMKQEQRLDIDVEMSAYILDEQGDPVH